MKDYIITVNGTAYEVTVEEGRKAAAPATQTPVVSAAPKAAPAEPAEKPKAEEPKAAPIPGGAAGAVKVNSPMPGKILALKASTGQTVKQGDVILILEAMKMENEIVAPEAGTVASIHVAVGDMVEAGVLLATLS